MILQRVDKLPLSIRIYIALVCILLLVTFFQFIPEQLWLQVPLYLYLLDFGLNLFKEIYFWFKARKDAKDLHPYFTKNEVANATHYFIPTRSQEIAPEIQEDKERRYMRASSEPLIPKMLKYEFIEESNRYFLVLADSGMGKTTFMINLYLAYQRQWKKKYSIKLLPFGYPNLLKEIEKIDDQRSTILLLDAFDEDNKAVKNYRSRLNAVLKKTKEFRNVLITCRTQFFSSQKDEPHATGEFKFGPEGGEHYFRKVYVSPFNEKDIKSYLHKRFPFGLLQHKKRKKAWRIVNNSPSLMVRPMLLSHIEDLVIEEKEYKYNYQVYEVLIQKWIEREAGKPGIKELHGSKEKFKKKLEKFSRDLSIQLYKNRANHKVKWALHKDDKIFSESGLFPKNTDNESETIGSSEWRTRSLLNRDVDGYYKFSHKSIMEYFLALNAFANLQFYKDFSFDGMEATRMFFGELIDNHIMSNNEIQLSNNFSSLTLKKTDTFDFSKLAFYDQTVLKEIIIFDKHKLSLLYKLYRTLPYYDVKNFFLKQLDMSLSSPHTKILDKHLKKLAGFKIDERIDYLSKLELLDTSEILEIQNHINNLKTHQDIIIQAMFGQYVKKSMSLTPIISYLDSIQVPELREKLYSFKTKNRVKRLTSSEPWNITSLENKIEDLRELLTIITEYKLYFEKQKSISNLEGEFEILLEMQSKINPNTMLLLNDFIEQCQSLEAEMPHVKFYY